MLPKYRFYINAAGDSQRLANPNWKDDLALEWKMESQQMFHRSELSGNLDFLRADYDYIMGKAFGTVFYVEIQISDNGASWSSYWKGKFTLTDCKVNVDHKIISVKPQTDDAYSKILAGLDNEYDLIKLAPEINKIRLSRRPAIQIFDGESETCTCVCGNLSFEQDVSLPMDNVQTFIRQHCHFQLLKDIIELEFTQVPWPYEQYFEQPFSGEITGTGSTLTNSTNTYFIIYEVGLSIEGLYVCSRAQPSVTQWKYEQVIGEYGAGYFPAEIEFESQMTTVGNLKANCIDHSLYSRVICNKKSANSGDTYEIPSDDIVTYNRNYRRCYPYDASSMIYSSQRTQSDPTEWGVNDSGDYYLPPDDTYQYIPIGRNLWGINSIWLRKTNDYTDIEDDATYFFMLNDAYPLYSVLQVLLNKIDPNIHFDGTADYSHFLYSGWDYIQGRDNGLWLTPKSNITNGEYQTPAMKGKITLKDIFNMLKNTYRCYWFLGTVNSQTALRIEHVKYFLNGGTYTPPFVPTAAIDLTSLTNKRNGKKWDYNTDTYEFEKLDMPERYQFAWMDEVTEIFKGQPIIIVSQFVEQGKVEEINVSNFTSDLDIMMLNPSGISQDGFALINALLDGNNELYVPIVNMPLGNYSYRAQNGWLSFHELQWAYWKDNMPSKHIEIEGDNVTADSVSRNKKQMVNIPLGLSDPDMYGLVKTSLGFGQIQQTSIRLTTRMAKTQLRYDTE